MLCIGLSCLYFREISIYGIAETFSIWAFVENYLSEIFQLWTMLIINTYLGNRKFNTLSLWVCVWAGKG